MSGHADTIRRAEEYIAAEACNVDDAYANAAKIMRELVIEIQQLRDAIEEFLAPWGPEHYPQLRAALDGTP